MIEPATPYVPPEEGFPVVIVDVPITRRKSFTYVIDHRGETLYVAGSFAEAFMWIVDQELNSCVIQVKEYRFLIKLKNLDKEDPKNIPCKEP